MKNSPTDHYSWNDGIIKDGKYVKLQEYLCGELPAKLITNKHTHQHTHIYPYILDL